MAFDLGRSLASAHPALRYVEDLTHRVKNFLLGSRIRTDPVAWLVQRHRLARRDADGSALRHAYDVAEAAHEGQFRKSGDPFISHPLAVAHILAELGMDTTTLVAALLHDTVEDTTYTVGQLRADFGSEVALLVDGVTKFEKIAYGDAAEVETYRKMIVAAGVDVRVLIIKLADRLHNMRTLDARSDGVADPHRPGHPGRADPAVRPARHPGTQARTRGQRAGRAGTGGAPGCSRRGSATGRSGRHIPTTSSTGRAP